MKIRGVEADAGAWLERHIAAAARWLLPALLLLAGAVRVARWNTIAVLFNDGPAFLEVSAAFRRGEFEQALAHPYHPGYSAIVALLSPLFDRPETAGVVVSVFGGVLSVLGLFLLVRSAFGVAPALVAAALLAVNPAAIEYSGDVQSDGLYLGLFLVAAAALFAALENAGRTRAVVGGALAGAAYLVRPEALGLAVVIGVRLLVRWLRGHWTFGRAFVFGLCFLVGAVAVAGPYLVYLRSVSGDWTLSQKKSVGAMMGAEEVPDEGPELRLETASDAPGALDERIVEAWENAEPIALGESAPGGAPAPQAAASAERPHPRGAQPELGASEPDPVPVRKEREKAAGQPLLLALGDVLRTHFRALRYEVLAFLLAAALLVRRPLNRGDAFIATTIVVYGALLIALAYRYGYVSGRHALPSMVMTMGWAASGLLAFAAWASRGRHRTSVAVLLALFAVIAGIGLGKSLKPDRMDALAERRAAEWLRDQPVEVRGLAARKRRTAWYADAIHVSIPTAARAEDLARSGASHLILAAEDLAKYPGLSRELAGDTYVIHREEAEGHVARVYPIPLRRSGPVGVP